MYEEFLINEISRLAFRKVTATEPLISSGILDSIMVVDLAISIEKKFGIKIPFTDILPENFNTVDLIGKFIDQSKKPL